MESFELPKNQEEVPVTEPSPEDAHSIREVEYKTWKETYPSEESGITEEDIDWYFNDYKKSFSEKSIEKTEKELESLPENQHVLIAKDEEGNTVGYAWLMENDDNNEVGALYVLPEYQGKRVGSRLLEEAEKFFNKNKDTILTVAEHNKNAISFYEHKGFVDTGERRSLLTFPSGAEFKEIVMKSSRSDG